MTKSLKTEIWVYADLRNERLLAFSLNVLAKARELAQAVSGKAAIVLMGSSARDSSKDLAGSGVCMSVDASAEDCIAHGADLVYVLDNPCLAAPRADIYAAALAHANWLPGLPGSTTPA
jgi:electron transfer flavoprotein alpha subunit